MDGAAFGGERRLFHYLALLSLKGLGRAGLEVFFRAHSEAWLDQDLSVLVGQVRGSLVPDENAMAGARERAARQIQTMHELKLHARFRTDPGFSKGLLRLGDPPRLLFERGPEPPPRSVAVVGTRDPTPWGRGAARECAEALARADIAVLNGLAQGIDREALERALALKARCVGVLASGHGPAERPSGGDLASRVLQAGGSLVSEYPPDTPPHKGRFIERDRVQAGLSAAVLVVESGAEGGTMHTALAARKAGVPLFALLGDEDLSLAQKGDAKLPSQRRGNWRLIASGAAVRVPSAAHCMRELDAAF